MGYQALLFCTDEKLARVVNQLFSELEFAVTSVIDPFAAVKSLMAQHYDAVVIDCENEQGASLMIKSARSSSFNQGSLAIGLVEGQAGVAKAYRMGANLVLTKPINIEAAKGTLRVARGLLRKGTETTWGNHVAVAPGTAPPASGYSPSPNINIGGSSTSGGSNAATGPSPSRSGEDSLETSRPAAPYPAFARSEQTQSLTPVLPIKPWTSIGSTVPVAHIPAAPAPIGPPQAFARPESVTATIEPPRPAATPSVVAPARSHDAAAAPAPARITAPSPQPTYEEEQAEFAEDQAFSSANFPASTAITQSPSFSMETEHPGGSGGSRKILIGAAAVLLLIGGYFGWTRFGQSQPVSAPVAAVPQVPPTSAPSSPTATPAQIASTVPAPVPGHATQAAQPNHSPGNVPPLTTGSVTQGSPIPAASNQSGATALSESTDIKPAPAPILVKPGTTARTRTQTQNPSEEGSAQPPSPLGVATAPTVGLRDLLTSASTSAKPSLARVKLSQGVSQGLLIKRVEPQYPRNALSTHTQGTVQIEATISKEGRVVSPRVLSGPFMLAPAALDAVRQWRYKPYYLDGEPVEVQTQITINFKTQ